MPHLRSWLPSCRCRQLALLSVLLGVAWSTAEQQLPGSCVHGQGDTSAHACAASDATEAHDDTALLHQYPLKLEKREIAPKQAPENREPVSKHAQVQVQLPDLKDKERAHAGTVFITKPGPADPLASDFAKNAGVKANAEHDLEAFVSAFIMNSGTVLGMLGFFMFLKSSFPKMYANNVLAGIAPETPQEGVFGWVYASLGTSNAEVEKKMGLDHAMLLEFSNLGMRIMFRIGLPLVVVLGPLHLFFGGGYAGKDHLSYLSFGNIHPDHWMYWVHPFFVWAVVYIVVKSVYEAQAEFLPRRFSWLREVPEPRSTTVLVEGIPPESRSDKELKKFFVEMFSEEKVKSAYVVKMTKALCADIQSKAGAEHSLAEANAKWEREGKDPAKRPQVFNYTGYEDSINYYQKEVDDFDTKIKAERARINEEASTVGGVNASAGLVTFHERSDAEVAMRLDYHANGDHWVVSHPPDPSCIRWVDLEDDETAAGAEASVGYGLVAALYFLYIPITVGIAKLAGMLDMGPFQPLWVGFAPSIGLTLMISFLPTFLILIFKQCFSLKDENWAQHKLQTYYFWFNVTFVILITAVGSSVTEFARLLLTEPFAIFGLFGRTMPQATHFYMNYMVLQWVTHSMNMTRYINLGKFLAFRKLYSEDEAREMAEPEDQDYYGMGSRSARWTTMLLIGIIYSTLSPPIAVLTFLNFAIVRLEYGYLIPFAETKKADLGGAFWVQKMHHIFVGCGIYCILMVGVLYGRASHSGPAIMAAPTIAYVVWAYKRFVAEFQWEKLPFSELRREAVYPQKPNGALYVQTELLDK